MNFKVVKTFEELKESVAFFKNLDDAIVFIEFMNSRINPNVGIKYGLEIIK